MSRPGLSLGLAGAARLALFGALVLLPWRWQLILWARPAPPIYGDFTHLIIYAHELWLLVGVVAGLIALLKAERRIPLGPLLLTGPLVALTALLYISSLSAISIPLTLYQGLRGTLHLGLYFVLVGRILPWGWLVAGLSGGLLLQSAVAWGQVWLQRSIGWQQVGELSVDLVAPGAVLVWGPAGWRALRAYGLTDHPNILAMHLALAALVLVVWLRQAVGWQAQMALFGLSLAGAALFLTFHRESWTALAIGLAFVAWLSWHYRAEAPKRGWPVLLGSLLLLALPLLWPFRPALQLGQTAYDIELRLGEAERQAELRRSLTALSNDLVRAQPALGVGAGNLPLAMRREAPEFPFDYQPSFNTIVTAIAELGLFGGLFYLLALAAPWLLLAIQRQHLTWRPPLLAAYGLLAMLLWLGLVDAFTWSFAAGRFWQYLAWGLWAAASAQNDQSSQRQ